MHKGINNQSVRKWYDVGGDIAAVVITAIIIIIARDDEECNNVSVATGHRQTNRH